MLALDSRQGDLNMPHYFYNGKDITVDVLMKIEEVVRLLSERLSEPFDEMLFKFYKSKTCKALKNTDSCMWGESSPFIADEYLRESASENGTELNAIFPKISRREQKA